MVDPKIMCRQHLLGEHNECHMFAGTMRKGISIDGYIKNNCCEPESIVSRHDELASEMTLRGYKHKTPLTEVRMDIYKKARIDKELSLKTLLDRCPECRRNHG
jgi:hypothetical protein